VIEVAVGSVIRSTDSIRATDAAITTFFIVAAGVRSKHRNNVNRSQADVRSKVGHLSAHRTLGAVEVSRAFGRASELSAGLVCFALVAENTVDVLKLSISTSDGVAVVTAFFVTEVGFVSTSAK
jgi:hypothetical protein